MEQRRLRVDDIVTVDEGRITLRIKLNVPDNTGAIIGEITTGHPLSGQYHAVRESACLLLSKSQFAVGDFISVFGGIYCGVVVVSTPNVHGEIVYQVTTPTQYSDRYFVADEKHINHSKVA